MGSETARSAPTTSPNAQSVSPETLFTGWVQEHRGIIVKVARSFTTEPADTDDLMQEILLRIWASTERYRGDAKVSTWLYRVALNRALTWQRDGEKRRSDLPLSATAGELAGPARAEDREQLNRLYDHIRRLSPIDRALILLSLDGMTYAEMADITGITTTNVGARLTRARTRLETFIEEDHA